MEIKSETSYTKNIKCSDVYTESAVDYSLPDYLGDVRKILFTEATLRPSGRFAGGDEVEFSGVVVYNVIYLDSDGNLSSAELTSDYDYTVKCSGESYKDSVSDTRVSAFSVRLAGPRKISARASLVGSVRISVQDMLSVSGNAFESEYSPETSRKTVLVRNTKISSSTEREYAEQVATFEGAIMDDVKVVYSFAESICDSLSVEDGAVSVKGRLRISALVESEDQAAFPSEKIIPFEEKVDFEGADPLMCFSPKLTVSSVKANVNPTETGCELVMNCILELCVVADCNEPVELLLDAYLKKASSENSYQNFGYSSLVCHSSAKGTHNAEIDRSSLESDLVREIVLMTATPKVEKVECIDSVVNIHGEVRYSGIASEMIGDKISYFSIKSSSPFATNVNIDCQKCDNLQIDARVFAHSTAVNIDAENIYVSCVLESDVLVCEEKNEKVLSAFSIKEGEDQDRVNAKITVYYPSDDDTLFSVAKRFKTSVLKVAKDNDISESVFSSNNPDGKLSGIKKLVIY